MIKGAAKRVGRWIVSASNNIRSNRSILQYSLWTRNFAPRGERWSGWRKPSSQIRVEFSLIGSVKRDLFLRRTTARDIRPCHASDLLLRVLDTPFQSLTVRRKPLIRQYDVCLSLCCLLCLHLDCLARTISFELVTDSTFDCTRLILALPSSMTVLEASGTSHDFWFVFKLCHRDRQESLDVWWV